MKLIGSKIINIRPMTAQEYESEGWDRPTMLIELDNGCKIYASRDEEGNGGGCLFGSKGENKYYINKEEENEGENK